MLRSRPLAMHVVLVLPFACGPGIRASGGSGSGTAGDTEVAGASASETSGSGDALGCDVLQQDCARGQKCLPRQSSHIAIITDEGPWCAAIAPEGAAVGERCTIDPGAAFEPGVVFDTCGAGLICWDAEDLEGRCERLCTEGDMGPSCPDGFYCPQGQALNGVVCVPFCDPLAQNCAYPTDTCNLMDGAWGCYPRDVSSAGARGGYCGSQNDCAVGLACVSDDELAGCSNSFGACCAPICDRDRPEPDTACNAIDSALACRPWSEAEAAGSGSIGVCIPA